MNEERLRLCEQCLVELQTIAGQNRDLMLRMETALFGTPEHAGALEQIRTIREELRVRDRIARFRAAVAAAFMSAVLGYFVWSHR